MVNPEATLRDMERQKEASRSANGQSDYKNDPESFVFRTINGQPSLSYYAIYTSDGEVHAEYFLRLLGPSGYVMFFNRGPVKDVRALIPSIVAMAGTVKVREPCTEGVWSLIQVLNFAQYSLHPAANSGASPQGTSPE